MVMKSPAMLRMGMTVSLAHVAEAEVTHGTSQNLVCTGEHAFLDAAATSWRLCEPE